MLSDSKGKCYTKYVPDYCIFDLETTGVSCANDEVVEISALKVIGGKVVDEYSTLVNPGRPIPYYASVVNGITDDMVADSPDFETAFRGFLDFVGDMVLVGHNIHTFDMKFLYRDAGKFWGRTIGNDYIDTLKIARLCLPRLDHHRLVDLAEYYGISIAGAHRALNDCRMNQIVFERLGQELANSSDAPKAVRVCPRCGSVLQKRSGRYGDFIGCTGFPNCRYTEDIC
ncbi:MAG: topoisomerase DNA-binding C4 zinc finger domain-containing protein [Lachnospiraceae bacterium]|nr:topoisomerase DNA-binding C4 zinc finger domain-containing protein [Lachnospiraceae bacterium]